MRVLGTIIIKSRIRRSYNELELKVRREVGSARWRVLE